MNVIFYLLIIFSSIGIFVVLGRKIPRLARLSEEEMFFLDRRKSLEQKNREINNHQHQVNLMANLEKFLRRIKIWVLKIENLLSEWIKKSKEKSWQISQKSKQLIEQRKIEVKSKKLPEFIRRIKIWQKNQKQTTDGLIKTEKETISLEKLEGNLIDASSINSQISIADLEKPIKEEQQWIDLIIQNPKNMIAYKSLGLLYFKQHNYSDAKASLEMAVKLGSGDKKVKEILEELKGIEIKSKPL